VKNLQLKGIMLTGIVRVPHSEPDALFSSVKPGPAGIRRSIYMGDGRWVEAQVYKWDKIEAPLRVSGSCVLESHDTTVVVPTDFEMFLDKRRKARICRSSSSDRNSI
jgi:N-methylhydantoinase A/oxoprolinase/acetone carboxylase beta subunit